MTRYELRTTNIPLKPGLRRWVEKLEAGYVIRHETIVQAGSFPHWSWKLYNREGAFVQTVRRDTVARLIGLGVIGRVDEPLMAMEDGDGEDEHAGMDGADGRGAG